VPEAKSEARLRPHHRLGPVRSLAQRRGTTSLLAITGALHAIGRKGERPVRRHLVGDFGGGGVYLAMGMIAALFEARVREGTGVDAAMTDGRAS